MPLLHTALRRSQTLFRLSKLASKNMRMCHFDHQTFSFEGTPINQASCLLRKVLPPGKRAMRRPLTSRVGKYGRLPCDLTRVQLAAYLVSHGIQVAAIGGELDQPVCRTDGKAAPATTAPYLTIESPISIGQSTHPPFAGVYHRHKLPPMIGCARPREWRDCVGNDRARCIRLARRCSGLHACSLAHTASRKTQKGPFLS